LEAAWEKKKKKKKKKKTGEFHRRGINRKEAIHEKMRPEDKITLPCARKEASRCCSQVMFKKTGRDQ